MKIISMFLVLVTAAFIISPLQALAQVYWQAAGLTDSNITSMNTNSKGVLLATVDEKRLYMSTDAGESWNAIPAPPLFISETAIDSANTIYAGDIDAFNNGLQRSTDLGAHWSVISDSGTIGCYSLGVSPGGFLFATFSDPLGGLVHTLFRSSDRGDSWQRDTVPFSAAVPNINTQSVYLFTGRDTMLAIGTDGLYRSVDNGLTWARKDSGRPALQINSLARTRTNELYLAGNYITHVGGAWRSSDGGDSWWQCDTLGLPAFASFTDIMTDSRDLLYGIVYGTLADGIYRSSDDGHSWSNVTSGLESSGIRTILIAGNGGTMFCGTQFGVYKSTQSLTSVRGGRASQPSGFSLRQNFPNPFNPSTSISYDIPVRSNVLVRIYNPLGQFVATLLEGEKAPGSYSLSWDAGRFPSGVYFYTIEVQNIRDRGSVFSATRKMVVLK